MAAAAAADRPCTRHAGSGCCSTLCSCTLATQRAFRRHTAGHSAQTRHVSYHFPYTLGGLACCGGPSKVTNASMHLCLFLSLYFCAPPRGTRAIISLHQHQLVASAFGFHLHSTFFDAASPPCCVLCRASCINSIGAASAISLLPYVPIYHTSKMGNCCGKQSSKGEAGQAAREIASTAPKRDPGRPDWSWIGAGTSAIESCAAPPLSQRRSFRSASDMCCRPPICCRQGSGPRSSAPACCSSRHRRRRRSRHPADAAVCAADQRASRCRRGCCRCRGCVRAASTGGDQGRQQAQLADAV